MLRFILILSCLVSASPLSPSGSIRIQSTSRRSVILSPALLPLLPLKANALVKGVAPPPKSSKSRPKCSTIDECAEMTERIQKEEEAAARASLPPSMATAKGTRYLDLSPGTGTSAGQASICSIKFKVLKAGKRSYDGLSGEGTVVFSRGYMLEDGEKDGDLYTFDIGDREVVEGLRDGIVGMKVGGIRRISVLPQKGWEVKSKECDGGPGGTGTGGEIKTDYVVVPTATMVATEVCFDKKMRPFPLSYAEQRRMAQRFDQALIMEIELVEVKQTSAGI